MFYSDQRSLLFVAVLLAVAPIALRFAGMGPYLWLGLAIFGLNLVVCFLGAITKNRAAWLAYAFSCISMFVLFGMPGPLSLAAVVIPV